MGKPVCQWRRHGIGHAPISLAITSCKDRPAIRNPILSQTPIQNQLIRSSRHTWRCRSDFIQKQNAFRTMSLGIRQHGGNRPLDNLTITKWNAAQVTWLHLRQTNIDQRDVMPCRNFGYHLRFTYTGGAPQHHGCMMPFAGATEFLIEYCD